MAADRTTQVTHSEVRHEAKTQDAGRKKSQSAEESDKAEGGASQGSCQEVGGARTRAGEGKSKGQGTQARAEASR